MSLNLQAALNAIDDRLAIEPRITANKEVKCRVPSRESVSGTQSGYIDALDCEALAKAFSRLAEELRRES